MRVCAESRAPLMKTRPERGKERERGDQVKVKRLLVGIMGEEDMRGIVATHQTTAAEVLSGLGFAPKDHKVLHKIGAPPYESDERILSREIASDRIWVSPWNGDIG